MLGKNDRVVLDTLLPAQAHSVLRHGVFDAGFDAFYADFEREATRSWRLSFRAALFAGTWIAPLLIRRPPPLSLHDRDTRERALAALGSSRIYLLRQLLFVLKTVIGFCYGADQEVRNAIGFPHPRFDEAGKA